MTLLVAWGGVDTHGPSSAYIMPDSRISWSEKCTYDHGRKVYSFKQFPDIIGYCGDVLFPTLVISQIVDMADNGILFERNEDSKNRFQRIADKICFHFNLYPKIISTIKTSPFNIIHISRDIEKQYYLCNMISWKDGNFSFKSLDYPQESGLICSLGSGSKQFNRNYLRYKTGPTKNTSRSVYHCFCNTLSTTSDPFCGGPPQLVGIIRKPFSPSKSYGIIHKNKRYFLGALVKQEEIFDKIEWKNDLFEDCDGDNLKRKEMAQKQPDPLRP